MCIRDRLEEELEESGGSGAEELCRELEDELLEEEELELLLGLSLIHIYFIAPSHLGRGIGRTCFVRFQRIFPQ